MIRRLIDTVDWKQAPPEVQISRGERICLALARRGYSVTEVLTAISEESIYSAAVLLSRCRALDLIDRESAQALHQALSEHCAQALQTPEPDRLPALTAAALILEDAALMDCLIPHLLSLVSGEYKQAVEAGTVFSKQLYPMLAVTTRQISCLANFYTVFYDHCDRELAHALVYAKEEMLTVPHPVPRALESLCRRAFADGELRYLDILNKTFLGLPLAQWGINCHTVVQASLRSDPENVFRGLLLAELLAYGENDDPVLALDTWWQDQDRDPDQPAPDWPAIKNWLHMYYVSRRITLRPQGTPALLAQEPPLSGPSFPIRKTNAVQQQAFEALMAFPQYYIQSYLNFLGCYNVFTFHPNEETFPYALHTNIRYPQVTEYLLCQGFLPEQLISVYMNTSLRCTYPLLYLLKDVLPRLNPDLAQVSAAGAVSLYDLFRDYPLLLRVEAYTAPETGQRRYRLYYPKTSTSPLYLFFSPAWLAENQSDLDASLQAGAPLSCQITQLSVYPRKDGGLSWLICVIPTDDRLPAGNAIHGLMDRLDQILARGTYDDGDNHFISYLISTGSPNREQQLILARKILRCCCSLTKDPPVLRRFLMLMNNKDHGIYNACRHCTRGNWINPRHLSPDLFTEIRQHFRNLEPGSLSLDMAAFLYFNTLLKFAVSPGYFVHTWCSREQMRDLHCLSDRKPYVFSASVCYIKGNAIYFRLSYLYHQHAERFVWYAQPGETYCLKDPYFVQLQSYDPDTHLFRLCHPSAPRIYRSNDRS